MASEASFDFEVAHKTPTQEILKTILLTVGSPIPSPSVQHEHQGASLPFACIPRASAAPILDPIAVVRRHNVGGFEDLFYLSPIHYFPA